MAEPCVACQIEEGTETCHICDNLLCVECITSHLHCTDCNGTGVRTVHIMRNEAGELDYLHGIRTGETYQDLCRRCEETGIQH